VWISTSGKIRGINVLWNVDHEVKKDSLFYTLQSDAIVLSAHPTNRMFTIVSNGQETHNITAHQVRTMLKQRLSLTSSLKHKGAYRESSSSEKSISG
jgi:hypothetical protein